MRYVLSNIVYLFSITRRRRVLNQPWLIPTPLSDVELAGRLRKMRFDHLAPCRGARAQSLEPDHELADEASVGAQPSPAAQELDGRGRFS